MLNALVVAEPDDIQGELRDVRESSIREIPVEQRIVVRSRLQCIPIFQERQRQAVCFIARHARDGETSLDFVHCVTRATESAFVYGCLHVRYIFPSELTGTRIILPRLGRLYRTCQRLRQLARFPKNPITEPFFSLLSQPAAFLSAGFLFLNRIHAICD